MLLDEGTKKREKRGKMISFRLPASADAYARQLAKSSGGITNGLLDALALHETLHAKLLPLKFSLQSFAAQNKLDWGTQKAEVIALAVERALADAEKGRK